MPVIKSAKKRMRQSLKRRERNYPVRSRLKSLFKKQLMLVKDGNLAGAEKHLAAVYSVIDMACKKKIIHKNNASRKKSRLAKELNGLKERGGAKEVITPKKIKKTSKVKMKVKTEDKKTDKE